MCGGHVTGSVVERDHNGYKFLGYLFIDNNNTKIIKKVQKMLRERERQMMKREREREEREIVVFFWLFWLTLVNSGCDFILLFVFYMCRMVMMTGQADQLRRP